MRYQCPRCATTVDAAPATMLRCPTCAFAAPAPGGSAPAPIAPPGAPWPATPGVQAHTSGLAIASLVTGLLSLIGFMFFGFALGIVAIITGALGMKECREQAKPGHGMAVAGLVLGVVSFLPFLLFLSMGFWMGW